MSVETLPLVNFGKYKDRPVTDLLQDSKYIDWLKTQSWFKEKYSNIYNITVNQVITTNNQNSKTPEHNRLQNLFLTNDNQKKLLLQCFKIMLNKIKQNISLLLNDKDFIECFGPTIMPNIDINTKNNDIKFEGRYNWDLIITFIDPIKFEIKLNIENELNKLNIYKNNFNNQEFNKLLEEWHGNFKGACLEYRKYSHYNKIINKYIKEDDYDISIGDNGNNITLFFELNYQCNIFCEIKPVIGEDYPCVLRKLKTQQELTMNDIKKKYEDRYFLNKKIYILIIETFTTTYTTKEQLIEIFSQTGIKVIFTNDIFSSDILEKLDYKTSLIEENKILKNKVLQLEEKIKLLENSH
jgi:hypothetical protein